MRQNFFSALFLLTLSITVSAQTVNPKITAEDLSLCKNEIAELHRREILHIKNQVHEYCTRGPDTHYAADSCKNMNEWLAESSSTSNLAWFIKGNDHCEGSDYPCFGLGLYEGAEPREDLIRSDATEPPRPDSGDLWGYQGAEKCVSKIWIAKIDRDKPTTSRVVPTSSSRTAVSQLSAALVVAGCQPELKSLGGNEKNTADKFLKLLELNDPEFTAEILQRMYQESQNSKNATGKEIAEAGLSHCMMKLRIEQLQGKTFLVTNNPQPAQSSIKNGSTKPALDAPATQTKIQTKIQANTQTNTQTKKVEQPGTAALTASQIADCSAEIKRTQVESQGWAGNVNDVAARLGRFQKELFEGRCAGHPEAAAYIAGANKMIGYQATATASAGGSLPSLASGSAASTTRNSSGTDNQHKVNNPAADAKGCVKLIQDSAKPGAGISGNWRFGNECNSSVEIFWCFLQDNGECRFGGTWTVSAGKGLPTFGNQPIKWGACRGKNGGRFNRESNGDSYTCELLKW